ncbi:uncharacterized protein F4822DRAFT_148245 [Hypoxylon trugodes]|uniref:uncharacterized protein n=1 Tax=Hypoxylon trugodes TaxID=326681 RepID=UPI00218EA54E|nr:uncharacterized protein F4822DRAFT_148245 [Hypoxylon trugodes]KAI1393014.1 hypothetical protein F4822DRAFT_148245 [Hypoxylon trugodes]
MLSFLTSVTSTKSTAPPMNAGCGFHLEVTGGFNGPVGQLGNGQARAGSDLPPSLFTWFGDAFADQEGRGCWWTPPTSVLQCDRNQRPDHGFGIGCYGGVSYRDQSTFYECHTNDDYEVNLYLEPNGANCSTITIRADNCRPLCAGETLTPSSSSSSSTSLTITPFEAVTTTTVTKSSPTTITRPPSSGPTARPPSTHGNCDVVVAQAPTEIVLVDKNNPSTSYGPNPDMLVRLSPNSSAVFVFPISASDGGKECAVLFNLPPAQEEFQDYKLKGNGLISFALLNGTLADPGHTTYGNLPGIAASLESVELRPDMSVQPVTFECPGVDTNFTVAMRDAPGSDACLEYRQNETDVLVGMYLLKC